MSNILLYFYRIDIQMAPNERRDKVSKEGPTDSSPTIATTTEAAIANPTEEA